MKKFTFILSTLTLLLFSFDLKAQTQTIVRNGFENWTDIHHPTAWFGSKTKGIISKKGLIFVLKYNHYAN